MRSAEREVLTVEHVNVEPIAVRYITAAKMLEVSESTVRKLEREGKLRTILVGADRRVTIESIKTYGK